MRRIFQKKVEIITSSRAHKAQNDINAFLETIDPMYLCEIKPLICFSGPSMIIGAMIEYEVPIEIEEEVTNGFTGN